MKLTPRSGGLNRVFVAALVGATAGFLIWATLLFYGMQAALSNLQSQAGHPNEFLLEITFAPQRYLVIFVLVGSLIGLFVGAFLGVRAAKGRRSQQVNQPSGADVWPPPPTPPA